MSWSICQDSKGQVSSPWCLPSLSHGEQPIPWAQSWAPSSGQPAQRCLLLLAAFITCSPRHPPAATAGRRAFPAQTAFICIVHLPSEVANAARKFPSRFLAVVSANREKVGGSQPCTVHTARILILRQLQTLAVYVKLQSQREKI